MQTAPLPHAFDDLQNAVGQELPLDSFHGLVRRTAQSVRSVKNYGTCLISCSDEFNGEVRDGFDRDVARPLMATLASRNRRTFTQATLGGCVEPGTFGLVDDHFRLTPVRDRLLLFQIAVHLGRRPDGHRHVHGEIDRFGRASKCCGALATVLAPPAAWAAVHQPWFEHMNTLFGEKRLAELRELDHHRGMIQASIVHASLQAESIVADALRAPPDLPTWILVVSLVTINQPGVDGALPVCFHLLRSDGATTHLERGFGLRTSPSALRVDTANGRLHVDAGAAMEAVESAPRAEELEAALEAEVEELESGMASGLSDAHLAAARERIEVTREQAERLRSDPVAWRVYARPLLRSLFQGLTIVAPEVGLAAMMLETGAEWVSARHRKRVLEAGPSSPQARRALQDAEASIQQLSHREAQEVLEVLLADSSFKR
jgi:hypothetical protein